MRTLLYVGAHPDDETFFAGTIAKYSDEGGHVSIACATRGERGSTAGLCTIEELPRVREAEMRDAAQALGVKEDLFLAIRGSEAGASSTEEIRRQLVELIRKARPQIVITFDPNGANQHADHIAISRFTSDALAAAADERATRSPAPQAGAPRSRLSAEAIISTIARKPIP
jgi:N-acetylglucosamine malate deacetylase 2